MKDHNIPRMKDSIWFCINRSGVGESQKLASQELLQSVQILNRQHAHLAQEQLLSSVLHARVSIISLIFDPQRRRILSGNMAETR